MEELTAKALQALLRTACQAQISSVTLWHEQEIPDISSVCPEGLVDLIVRQHLKNFQLWHVEDRARRTDVDDQVITACKRQIDSLNQQRNDLMEQVDAWLVSAMSHFPAQQSIPEQEKRFNTETLGAALDRLSILSLKIYHMAEQTVRQDVPPEHLAVCQEKLAILRLQHRDLSQSILDLVDEYAQGKKTPKVYFQCKMYNDPALNPELYAAQPSRDE